MIPWYNHQTIQKQRFSITRNTSCDEARHCWL